MDNIFNTVYEVSLRILLILATENSSENTVERISALDFITVNGATFGISDKNINGNSVFRFGEFPLRRDLTKDALIELVLDGFVIVKQTKIGFCYVITDRGKECCAEFDSDYAAEYYSTLVRVLMAIKGKTERELLTLIYKKSTVLR